jgi:hypothetical protein
MMLHATAEMTPEPERLRVGVLLWQLSVTWKYSALSRHRNNAD